MCIEIINVGDEVLQGRVINTNAAHISRALAMQGWEVLRQTTLPDQEKSLEKGVREALERADCLLLTGGIGPTLDDMTPQVVSKIVPTHPTPLFNRVGHAPGLIFRQGKKHLILMPGVPLEMEVMLDEQVMPYLLEILPKKSHAQESCHFCYLHEEKIDPFLRKWHEEFPEVRMGIYPSFEGLTVVFQGSEYEPLQELKERAKAAFPTHYMPKGKVEEVLHGEFAARRKTLSLAESCTGGMIAEKVTSIPGASDYFLGSIVAYSNGLKQSLLGVKEETLRRYGAVSREVVFEMLDGLFEKTHSDFGVAVSGIAGPTGGSDSKPVGTVWAALGERGKPYDIATFHLPGNRQKIITRTTYRLLSALWRKIAYGEKFE